jgi:chromosome segregation ATPase
MAVSGVVDLLQQAGAALGTGGAALAGHVWRSIRTAITKAKEAEAKVKALEEMLTKRLDLEAEIAARRVAERAFGPYRSTPAALRLEMDGFQEEMRDTVARAGRQPSRPDLAGVEETSRRMDEMSRRIDALDRRLKELNDELLRERGQRHALGRETTQRHDEVMRTCNDLKGLVSELKGTLKGWERALERR